MSSKVESEPLFLHGVGHFHPENELTNSFLESLDIGTDDQWIMDRVGIRKRRTVLSLDYIRETRNKNPALSFNASQYSNAQTGALAAKMALQRARIEVSDIGLVLAGGCSPQHTTPAEACVIAKELGIQAPAMDLNSACTSFVAQLHFLRMMRPEAMPDYVLIINVENNTRTIDYTDRGTAVLWGDGSAAAVVSFRHQAPLQVVHTQVQSDPSGWEKVVIPTGGHFFQLGAQVQGFAVRKSLATLEDLRARSRVEASNLYYIGHQANLTMLNSVCERGGINPSRHLYNVDEFGNCGAAGAPSVLSQHWGRFRAGDEIAMALVGSGLTWGGVLLRNSGE